MEKQLIWFREESLKLYNKLEEQKKENYELKFKVEETEKEKEFLEEQTKSLLKKNRLLEIQLQNIDASNLNDASYNEMIQPIQEKPHT